MNNEVLERVNTLRVGLGKSMLGRWRGSSDELVEYLEVLEVLSQRHTSSTGAIMRMCEALVCEPNLSYTDIVAQVRKAHPEARTSTKSLASVAKNLRKRGVPVPMRQRGRVEA